MTEQEFREIADTKDTLNVGDIYSNFDHEFDNETRRDFDGAERALAYHPAWEFHGDILKYKGKYYELIMRYHSCREIIEGDALEEVIEVANEKYGYE